VSLADLDLDRLGHFQGLGIGVGGNEFHPLQVGEIMLLTGVAAGAADTDDLDFCRIFVFHVRKCHFPHLSFCCCRRRRIFLVPKDSAGLK
jgi:hypothetical protein